MTIAICHWQVLFVLVLQCMSVSLRALGDTPEQWANKRLTMYLALSPSDRVQQFSLRDMLAIGEQAAADTDIEIVTSGYPSTG